MDDQISSQFPAGKLERLIGGHLDPPGSSLLTDITRARAQRRRRGRALPGRATGMLGLAGFYVFSKPPDGQSVSSSNAASALVAQPPVQPAPSGANPTPVAPSSAPVLTAPEVARPAPEVIRPAPEVIRPAPEVARPAPPAEVTRPGAPKPGAAQSPQSQTAAPVVRKYRRPVETAPAPAPAPAPQAPIEDLPRNPYR